MSPLNPAQQEIIDRLRGAERAAEVARPVAEPCPAAASTAAKPAPLAAQSPNPVLIGAASVTLVALVVGTVFGLKALADDPSGASTSAQLSATALRQRGQRAEREALVADLAFGLAAASVGTFAGVWLLSPGVPGQRSACVTLRGYF